MHLKRICILIFLDVMSEKYKFSLNFLFCKLRSYCLIDFCREDLSIDVSGVLKSSTMIVFPSISPFMSVSICCMYLGAPILGAYISMTLLEWILYH